MKKILLIVFIANVFFAKGQTTSSIQSGNWTNPNTWDCNCIPTANYSVTIYHQVTLNTNISFTTSTSGLYIDNIGSLQQDNGLRDILVNGCHFDNYGIVNVNHFIILSSSYELFNYSGATMAVTSLANSWVFENQGTFIADSVNNAYNFENDGSTQINNLINASGAIFYMLSGGTINWIENYGVMEFNSLPPFPVNGISLVNNGSFYNEGNSFSLSGDLRNTGRFSNYQGVALPIGGNFYNSNPSTHNANFANEGTINIQGSWYNADTVRGSPYGSFSVQDSSVNTGIMQGSFRFCDATPISTNEVVDSNTGNISPGITTCSRSSIFQLHNQNPEIKIYPNPSSEILNIEINSSNMTHQEMKIEDVLGNEILKQSLSTNHSNINISNLQNGVYIIRVGNSVQKFIVQH
ncbi:MAG: T9SS type A sorting domain-containing protein [Bacteroidia bacterium]